MARRPLRFALAFRALGVCEHIWLLYKNFDPSFFDPNQKFGMSTWGLTLIFDPVPSTYFRLPFWHIGSTLVFFRTNGLSTKLYSHSNQRKIFSALFTLGYGNTACSLVFDFLYSSSQESLWSFFKWLIKFVYPFLPGCFTLLLQVHLNISSPRGVKKSTTDSFCRSMTLSERNMRNEFPEKRKIWCHYGRATIHNGHFSQCSHK